MIRAAGSYRSWTTLPYVRRGFGSTGEIALYAARAIIAFELNAAHKPPGGTQACDKRRRGIEPPTDALPTCRWQVHREQPSRSSSLAAL
jgi:hypothetical protein